MLQMSDTVRVGVWVIILSLLATNKQCLGSKFGEIGEISVCSDSHATASYYIQGKTPCEQSRPAKVEHCTVDIFDPKLLHLPVDAYACSLKSQRYTATTYFWGEKVVTKDDPELSAPMVSQCSYMTNKKELPGAGVLTPVGETSWETKNHIQPQFHWLQSSSGKALNAFLDKVILFYNQVTGEMTSGLTQMSTCRYQDGFCMSDATTLIWKVNPQTVCDQIKKARVATANATLHYNKAGELQRLDVPSITASFMDFVQDDKLLNCFKSAQHSYLVAAEGLIIQFGVCEKEHKWGVRPHVLKSFQELQESPNTYLLHESLTADINFLSEMQNERMSELEAKLNLALCQQDNHLRQLLGMMAQMFPSEVLSMLMKKDVGAKVTTGGVITEMQCVSVNASLASSLKLEQNKYATKPLATVFMGNKTVIVQMHSANHWSQRIAFYATTPPNGYVTFKIGGRLVTYLNATLLSHPIAAQQIRLSGLNVTTRFPSFDFSQSRAMLGPEKLSESMAELAALVQGMDFQRKVITDDNGFDGVIDGNGTVLGGNRAVIGAGWHKPTLFGIGTFIRILSGSWGLILSAIVIWALLKRCNTQRCLGKPRERPMSERDFCLSELRRRADSAV